jgi:hypothetical protein
VIITGNLRNASFLRNNLALKVKRDSPCLYSGVFFGIKSFASIPDQNLLVVNHCFPPGPPSFPQIKQYVSNPFARILSSLEILGKLQLVLKPFSMSLASPGLLD